MTEFPLFTIVIPTLNQGEFIEQALDSVLSQQYPRLRLIVRDGGSTDATLAVLSRYERHLAGWSSAPDRGPWSVVQEVASSAEDGWFNWLNSDDFLLPGSLSALAELIHASPEVRWISGARLDVDRDGRPLRSICPWLQNPAGLAFGMPFLPQDATFFRLDLFQQAACLVPADLGCIFDTILHRVAWKVEPPLLTTCVFSAMRWHGQQLTSSSPWRNSEYERLDVMALQEKLSPARRLLKRLSCTRFNPEISALLNAMISRGCFGTSDLKACVYWPWHLELKYCSVAEAYAHYRL